MTKRDASEKAGLVVPGPHDASRVEGWRGDEHRLQLDAAQEAGLSTRSVAVESFARGFADGSTLRDEWDGALVFRGRTPLRDDELATALAPVLARVGLPTGSCTLSVLDGTFEVRLPARIAEGALPALAAARGALGLWLGFAGAMLLTWHMLPRLWILIAWTAVSALAAVRMRRGTRRSRRMLQERMAEALAAYAQSSQLILPPASIPGKPPW